MTSKFLSDFDPLITKFGTEPPYEREYEGWVLRDMEDYFRELGLQFDYMTVSSKLETNEGMDQFLTLGGKYFCLQFKRPFIHKGRSRKIARDCKNISLYWDLNVRLSATAKSSQFDLITSRLRTYYVLPTFLNRELRRVSLNHILFWHPTNLDGERLFLRGSSKRMYMPIKCLGSYDLRDRDQRKALKNLTEIKDEDLADVVTQHGVRWGRFAEGLLHCNLGLKWKEGDVPDVFISKKNNVDKPKETKSPQNTTETIIARISPLTSHSPTIEST